MERQFGTWTRVFIDGAYFRLRKETRPHRLSSRVLTGQVHLAAGVLKGQASEKALCGGWADPDTAQVSVTPVRFS